MYIKQDKNDFKIYCYDDNNPVGSIYIKREEWDPVQIVSIHTKDIEEAEKRILHRKASEQRQEGILNFEGRKALIAQGGFAEESPKSGISVFAPEYK